MAQLSDAALAQLFLDARTHREWREGDVTHAELRKLYDLLKMGPTAMNCQPARFVFVKTREAKERLRPALMQGNVEKTMSAPVTVIVAYDAEFHTKLAKLWPHMPDAARDIAAMPKDAQTSMALLSATLQGGYLIMAARALGIDCGPMSGFDRDKVDQAFFPDGSWKSIFLINLGHGDASKLYPRGPRLDFEEACAIV
jgi:3-hydroxypropanoate dehydrogenase